MKALPRTWLTIDTDDVRHVPSNQGHPTRSKPDQGLPDLSERFKLGLKGFASWMRTHDYPVTMFVIADQCESDEFVQLMTELCVEFGHRITIGCHGLHHRSWSAWPKDEDGFSQDISQSVSILNHHFPQQFKRWFRAPAGYIASWMVSVLDEQGFLVDSSINPSWLVSKKYGKNETWKTVQSTVKQSRLIERPWKTRFSLPTCGPAQHIAGLRWNAKRAWKHLEKPLAVDEMSVVENPDIELDTIYWHVLDHARNNGTWIPDIKGL